MKVAIISDIHGNIIALDSALQSLESESPDKIVCLGDVAATGPRPHEALEKIRAVNALCVMGNTDEWLLNPTLRDAQSKQLRVIEGVDSWCSRQLSESDRDFLHTFKPTIRVHLGNDASLLAFHGSPRSYHQWISATASDDELKEIFSGDMATVMAGGHSHRQLLRRYRDTLLLNPGSIGLPTQRDRSTGKLHIPHWSEYAIISYERNSLDVSFKRVPLNFDDVVKSILGSDMPHKEIFLETWLSHIKSLLTEHKLT